MITRRRPASNIDPDLLVALAAMPGLDRQAVLAVASTEGGLSDREGDIGDLAGGGSYGPFQLYAKGALPAQYRGNSALADKWAWSREGINYALRKMLEAGAGGLKGQNAINTIVRKFERPADPDSQVAKALARYGQFSGGDAPLQSTATLGGASAPSTGRVTSASPPGGSSRLALLRGLMNDESIGELIGRLRGAREAETAAPSLPPPRPPGHRGVPESTTVPAGAPGLSGSLSEAFYDPLGGYDSGQLIKAIGGHSDHVHASIVKAQAMLRAIKQAQQMGLAVRENPYVDPVDPGHTTGSFHGRNFAGKYNNRTLGQGIDVSGDSAKMAAYYKWLLANLR